MNPAIAGGFPKGPTRKTVKRWKANAERKQKRIIRAEVLGRDGCCRVQSWHGFGDVGAVPFECSLDLEWAHMHARRRSQTRGQDRAARAQAKTSRPKVVPMRPKRPNVTAGQQKARRWG